MKKRLQTEENLAFKLGIDGGGGYLKFCLNVINSEELFIQNVKCRDTYSCGVAAKTMKSTGVNKLQIIALAPNIPESYENVLKLWTKTITTG